METPFIIHGNPGTGKSSLLARAATEVKKHYMIAGKGFNAPPIILRHCGTTPPSSNIRQLLQSLCHHVAFATSLYRHKVPVDFKKAKSYFKNLLQSGNFSGNLVIFLDALNDLSDEDGCMTLDWLPLKLAKNVKLILSTTTGSRVMQQLSMKYPAAAAGADGSYRELLELEAAKCTHIVQSLLAKRGREISAEQWQVVEQALAHCSLPLFTQLLVEEVSQWRSYTVVDVTALGTSVQECINLLFSRLEKKHGVAIVAKIIAYITASRDGISETELEDVTSLDDHLLSSVFQFWEPPIRRLPSMLLERFKNDIEVYLSTKQVSDVNVIYWCHQQFAEVAKHRYLRDAQTVREVHSNLADYYVGLWSLKPKPFEYSDIAMKRLKPRNRQTAALRYVPAQPLIFKSYEKGVVETSTEKARYNLRKLNQLPYHLAHAGRHLSLMSQVLFNYEWIHAKLTAVSVQKVISDYNLLTDRDDVTLVKCAFNFFSFSAHGYEYIKNDSQIVPSLFSVGACNCRVLVFLFGRWLTHCACQRRRWPRTRMFWGWS